MNLEVTVGQEVSAADGALARGARIVAESKITLNGELSSLEGRLSGIGAQWQGQAATAFASLMERWRTDARKIITSLDTFEQNLQSSQSSYTASDEQASSAMSRLQGRLG
ncbi:WXG100 family type VII secretion target [Occultella aeris]|uniref:ESAT-6-like protein n=1 Tax=Occultella aeris TaxID=2761496 RepID=A0A7M4DJ58_9MICO|nr:Proteins of 100 residues with WXG [Occultella aeris]